MAAIDVQLTARPTVEITHQNVFVGGVVTEQINGVTIGTVVSGTTNNQVIENTLGTPVGTAANPSVVPDATVQLNGTTVGTIPSWDSDSFTVNLNGSPSGVWDGTAWQVTSAPCNDATIELNGVEMTTIPSGDTENISIRQSSGATEVGSKQGVHWRIDDSAISINGSPVADVKAEDSLDIDVTQDGSPVGSWNGSAWIVPPSIVTSLSIEVYSDAGYTTPASSFNYGATAYIKLVPTGITPTSYSFFFGNGTKNAPQVTQVGDSLAWVVSLTGSITISATATDGTDATADATPFTLTSTLVIANSLKFDGVNDYIVGCSSLGVGEDWSVSFSVKMLNTARDNAFISLQGYRQGRPSFLIGYEDSSQELRFASWNTEWAVNSYTITPDTNWHKIVATYNYDTTTLKVYYDNVLIYTNTSWTINFSLTNLVYGFTDDWPLIGDRYGNIQVTDMRNHRATLTPTEVALVYNNQLSGHESSLVPVIESVGQTTGYIDSIIGNSRMQLNNMTSPFGIVLDAP
jgi:hypothetical protein